MLSRRAGEDRQRVTEDERSFPTVAMDGSSRDSDEERRVGVACTEPSTAYYVPGTVRDAGNGCNLRSRKPRGPSQEHPMTLLSNLPGQGLGKNIRDVALRDWKLFFFSTLELTRVAKITL